MSNAELELVSDASHPLMGNPDMTDPQVALVLQELSQGLGTAEQGAGSIKSLKDTADGPDAAIERLIPAGVKATRCLRVTYAIGNGSHHFAARVGNVRSHRAA